jgi:hypothetical protein
MTTLLLVKKQLTKIGEQLPYFSITAEEWKTDSLGRKTGRDMISGGCQHEEIEERYKGQYTDLIALHLSDINGVPSHAVENGWQFYSRGEFDTLKKHLRINDKGLKELKELVSNSRIGAPKQNFTAFVGLQKQRWAKEAAACIEKYDLKIVVC